MVAVRRIMARLTFKCHVSTSSSRILSISPFGGRAISSRGYRLYKGTYKQRWKIGCSYFPGHLKRVVVIRVTIQPPFCVARSTSTRSSFTQAMSSHRSFTPALQPYSVSSLENPVVQPREPFHSSNAYEEHAVLYVQ